MVFEQHSLTLHNTQYHKNQRKLCIEKVSVKNRKVIHHSTDDLDVSGIGPSALMELHQCIGDALHDSISEQELQTIRLKKRISELEDALTLKPLFPNPLAILPAEHTLPSTPEPQIQSQNPFNC
jgi:hypothetical protein